MTGPGPPAGGVPPAGVRTVGPGSDRTTRVVLVRHGESVCARDGIVGGIRGCTGLSPAGQAQAGALRDRLARTGELDGATALYASVLPRATETARAIAPVVGGGGLPVVEDCDLCELHPGEADGLTWTEFGRRYPEPDWDTDPTVPVSPGGESWTGFVERASSAVARLARRHPGELVVVACHAGVVEATLLAFLPVGGPGRRLKLHTAYTALTDWELGPVGWRLARYNDAAHLAP